MTSDFYLLIAVIVALTTIEIPIVMEFDNPPHSDGLAFFNPIRNYKVWISMNWFGVMLFTLLLNIVMPVYAICYWFYKLCTVGRKK